MPIASSRVKNIDSPDETGIRCKLVERDRDIHEFENFVTFGIDKDTGDVVMLKQSDRDLDVTALVELMKAYIKQFEDYYKENYGYPQELPLENVIKEIYGVAKEKDLDHSEYGSKCAEGKEGD